MKNIEFVKYSATGNDFILIDNRENKHSFTKEEVIKLCDRHFGIGSDGLIILEQEKGVDFKMIFYNPDASQDMMCGNGGRSIVSFAKSLGIIDKNAEFFSSNRLYRAEVSEINLQKSVVKLSLSNIENIEKVLDGYFLDIGTPHFIKFVEDIDRVDVKEEGAKLRYDKIFSNTNGTNANFVEIIRNGELRIRTYERGVEDETLACGTGITASAIVYCEKYNYKSNIVELNSKGGLLKVYFKKLGLGRYKDIFLEGEVERVFSGFISL